MSDEGRSGLQILVGMSTKYARVATSVADPPPADVESVSVHSESQLDVPRSAASPLRASTLVKLCVAAVLVLNLLSAHRNAKSGSKSHSNTDEPKFAGEEGVADHQPQLSRPVSFTSPAMQRGWERVHDIANRAAQQIASQVDNTYPFPQPTPAPQDSSDTPAFPQSRLKKSEPSPPRGAPLALQQCLREGVDWDALQRTYHTDHTAAQDHVRPFIEILSRFLTMEPLVGPDPHCKPEPLTLDTTPCSRYPDVLIPRDHPVKVAHVIQLGFDADVLEVHLNEIYDVVDRIFIIESKRTHLRKQPKPLIWEIVKHQPRFFKFTDKVVDLVVDDAQALSLSDGMWAVEAYQETDRWNRFLEWNKGTGMFSDEDMIGFGDADEISSRENFFLMKHCALKPGVDSVDVGIHVLEGSLVYSRKSDYPVGNGRGNLQYTYGDPTFFSLRTATAAKSPSRRRGHSGHYILGGIHLSDYNYGPFKMVKHLTATEGEGNQSGDKLRRLIADIHSMTGQEFEASQRKEWFGTLIKRTDSLRKNIESFYRVPWFLECNPDRYPEMYGKPDPRLWVPVDELPFECPKLTD